MKNRAEIIGSKLVIIITILTLVTYILINFINQNRVQAILYRDIYHQSNEEYDANKIASYPGYKELIEAMKAAHPNWKFTIFYTDIEWSKLIEEEKVHGRNVVPDYKSSEWRCSICGDTPVRRKFLEMCIRGGHILLYRP